MCLYFFAFSQHQQNYIAISVEELQASLLLHCCVLSSWHNIAVWFAQIFSFRFFICNSSRFCSFSPLYFLFLYCFRFTNCHNSHFHTHRTKRNNFLVFVFVMKIARSKVCKPSVVATGQYLSCQYLVVVKVSAHIASAHCMS